MDITSLYTVIPNDEGLRALKHFFDQRTVKEPSSVTLLRLAELVLTLNCFSFGGNYYKQTNGVAMGTKMGPSYANLFAGFIEHQFFSQYHGPKPDLYGRYIDDCIGATSSTKEELTQFITAVNSSHPALKYTWEICNCNFVNLYVLVFTTNLQIHIVTCCIHLHIHHTSRTPYLFHSFSDFVVYVVTTLIFTKNQRQCASFSINVAILFLSFKRATTVPNKSIDRQLYKRPTRKTLTVFHLLLHFTLTTTQLNLSFLKILSYSKTIQRLALSFRNPHLFHSNVTKT